jgi:hypothetical protein
MSGQMRASLDRGLELPSSEGFQYASAYSAANTHCRPRLLTIDLIDQFKTRLSCLDES